MADFNPIHRWRAILARNNDDPVKTVIVVLMVAFVCAVLVSASAVTLRPLQQANLEAERMERMQSMVAALPGLGDLLLEAGVDSLEAMVVELETGLVVADQDAASYDQRAAAIDPDVSVTIPPDADLAGLGRRAPYAPVYLLRDAGELALVVLPVSGAGYASTLYGYLALEGDLETIAALTFYEQGETPGLGARIAEPGWEALWPGTRIRDNDGTIAVSVVRGGAKESWQVDGISGATRTGAGVTALLQFWLGPDGFEPFLNRLRNGEIAS